MKKLRIGLLACASLLLISTLLIEGFGGQTTHAASVSNACGSWSIVPSANVSSGQTSSILSGIAASSSSDAWAVGYYDVKLNNIYTLTEHWNGSKWSIVPSPNAGKTNSDVLDAVTEISATNVWAVGYYYDLKKNTTFTLIEHWNGSKWQIVASPSPSSSDSELDAVTAISANDIWAVGAYYGSVYNTLVEHWNGSSWSVVSSPNNFYSVLNSVSALASNDVWAAGFFINGQNGKYQTLIEHWNGSQWGIVSSPNAGKYASSLHGITAISANDVWVTGVYQPKGPYVKFYQTLTEHWNGSSWSVVPSPNVGTYSNTLDGIAAVSTNELWAVGSYDTNSHNHSQALIEQWNGSSWSVVPSPVPVHKDSNYLDAIATIPGTSQVWAVGIHVPPSSTMDKTLAEYYC